MQDILGLDGWARMNYPSTCNDTNWSWRMKASEFTEERIGWLRNLIVTASRL
ncbi:MAG: 4-alpha-glucanotransferase [bacterium]|nr:4-alpha-glucanotransferase [bacterium]